MLRYSGMVRDQYKLLRHLAQEIGVSLGSAFTARRKIKFYPYKMIVHKLKQPGYAVRIYFYNWLMQNVHGRIMDAQLQFASDKVSP
jgi:hypothetical protein